MDTEFIQTAARRHKGKLASAGGGLSVAAVIFLYQHFTPVERFNEHCRDCRQQASEQWQATQDLILAVDRLRR